MIGYLAFGVFRVGRRRRGRLRRCEPRSAAAMHGGESGASTTALPAEPPMEALQRRFVDGTITMEQYESELDTLVRQR